jgi:hypothetical protein
MTVATLGSRLRSPQAKFYGFKLFNLVLTIAWGFLFTFVIIRVAGPRLFSLLALLNALSFSLAVAEMGISKIVFLVMRTPGGIHPGVASGLLRLYALVCAAACVVVAVSLPLFGATHEGWLLGALFFPSVVVNLIWVLVQNLALALGIYLQVEAIDAARRIAQIVALGACLLDTPLSAAFIAMAAIWLVALLVATRLLARHYQPVSWGESLAAARRFVIFHRRQISATFLFNFSELFIYQMPVFFVPWRFGVGVPVVVSDTFFKMHRATSSAYRAATESQVPGQVAAYEAGSMQRLRQATAASMLLVLPAFGAAALVLLVFGERFFTALTGVAAMLPLSLASVTVAFMAANAVQAVAGSLLLNTGQLHTIRNIGGSIAGLMVAAAAASYILAVDVLQFLWIYTLVYAVGAAFYAVTAARLVISMPQKDE